MGASVTSPLQRNGAAAVFGLAVEAPDLGAAQVCGVARHGAAVGRRVGVSGAGAGGAPFRRQGDVAVAGDGPAALFGADDRRIVLVVDLARIGGRISRHGYADRNPLRSPGEGQLGAGELAAPVFVMGLRK